MKMKNLLVAVCCLFISVSAQAQLKLGVKGGANYSQIKEKGDITFIDWEARTNFYAGAFAELVMNDRLSFRAEALYSFEGGEFENVFGGNQKVNINFLNLPLLLRLNLIYGVFIEAGIEPGVILDDGDAFIDKNAEFGALFGGGFRLGERLIFNLRYVQGLSNLYEFNATDVNGQPIGETRAKSTLWQIGAEFYIFK